MEWRPLVTNSQERARLRQIVREIATVLEQAPAPDTITNHCDQALLRAYLAADGALADDQDTMTAHVTPH